MRTKKVTGIGVRQGVGKASKRLAALRLCAFALCFVAVFAFTMAFGLSNINDNVAHAREMSDGDIPGWQKGVEATYGTLSAVTGDQGDITASTMGFPGTTTGKTSWEQNVTFANHVPTLDNTQFYKTDSDSFTIRVDENNHWEFKLGNTTKEHKLAWGMVYKIPEVISRIASNRLFTVKVTISFDKVKHIRNYGPHLSAKEVSGDDISSLSAKDITTLPNQTTMDKTGDSEVTVSPSLTLTLTGNTHIFLGIWADMYTHMTASKWVYAEGLHINFVIAMVISPTYYGNSYYNDGGAPVWGNDFNYVSGKEDFSYPFRSGDADGAPKLDDNWPVYDPTQLGGTNNRNYPADTSDKLMSYQSQPISVEGASGISQQYYKYTQLTAVDSYNYLNTQGFNAYTVFSDQISTTEKRNSMGLFHKFIDTSDNIGSASNLSWAASSKAYASGIKYVEMTVTDTATFAEGTQTANTYFSNFSTDYDLTAGGKTLAHVKLSKLDTDGYGGYIVGAVKIEVFVFANCELELVVKDFGDLELRRNITYGGIDPVAPDNETLTFVDSEGYDYFEKGKMGDALLRNESVSIDFSTSEEPIAPNFYYIEVKKTDVVEEPVENVDWKTFAHKDGDDPWKVILILTADVTEAPLSYNFKNGEFTYRGSVITAYNADGGDPPQGSGKYLFRIYAFDMAGNAAGETADYYINVDYEKPDFVAELTYGKDDNAGKLTATDKGKWITEDNVTLTLTPMLDDKPFFNTSGNTLAFESGARTIFVSAETRDGITAASDGTAQEGTIQDGKAIIEVQDSMDKTIKLSIRVINGVFTITFADNDGNASPDMALNVEFVLLVGTYSNAGEMDLDSGKRGDWKGGVDILVDKNAPTISNFTPTYGDEEVSAAKTIDVYESETEEGAFSADLTSLKDIAAGDREWFGYSTLGARVTLYEDMLSTGDYAEDYSIRVGVKAVADNQELQEFIDKEFLKHFNTDFDPNTALTWFDRYLALKGTEVDNGELVIADSGTNSINLSYNGRSNTSGLRLIFLWAVDQAGNCSAPIVRYLFSDSTNYNLTASVTSSSLLDKSTASISIQNGTNIKRGAEVTLRLFTADGYVPYMISLGNGGDVLLENRGANVNGLAPRQGYEALLHGYNEPQDGNIEITFKFDTLDYGDITQEERALQFKHRLVVEASFGASNRVTYKAASGKEAVAIAPEDLTLVIQGLSDDLASKAKAAFRLDYVDADDKPLYAKQGDPRGFTTSADEAEQLEDGSPKPFAAISAGSYAAYIYIPKDDEAFVESDIAFGEDGEQTRAHKVDIIVDPLKLYVVADEGEAEYGRKIELSCKLSLSENGEKYELNEKEGALQGSVKLDGVGEKADAGRYLIVQDTPFEITGTYKDNFTLAFVEGKQFTVLQREVSVVILAASKAFGDPDPVLQFGVDKAQFEGEDADVVLAEIFKDYQEATGEHAGYENFAIYQSYALRRAAGENEGKYDFDPDLSRLVVNSNYALVLDEESANQFEIAKRSVSIAVTGSTLLPYSADPQFDVAGAKFGYRLLNAADMIALVTDEIDDLLSKELFKIEGDPVDAAAAGNYSKTQYYTVTLADYDSENITLTLSTDSDDNKYYVYVAAAKVVVIEAKEGVALNIVFGTKWEGSTAFAYAGHKGDFAITIDGEEASFEDIVWSLKISGHEDDTYLAVGNYVASIEISQFVGGEEQEYQYIAGNIAVNVAPAEIVIKPTFEKQSRSYGGSDDEYGIGFEIVTVNGQPLGDEGYADIAKTAIEQMVKDGYGKAFAFVRAVFDEGGARYASASRQDGATDPATHLNADGRYYAAEFSGTSKLDGTHSANFTLAADTRETYLEVTPKPIEIDIAKFVGISKDYDGTNVAFYSGNSLLGEANAVLTHLAYDLRSQLLYGDEVQLGFEATYTALGDPATPVTESAITFSKFTLISADRKQGNYVISKIVNSAENGAKVSGENASKDYSRELEDGELETLTVEIVHIDNTTQDDTNNMICVRAGAIGLWYNDITLGKVYDGRTDFGNGTTLAISDRLAEDGTSKASPYLLKQAKWTLLDEWNGEKVNLLVDAEHGEQKYITLAVFFTFENLNVSDVTIANLNADEYPEYAGSDVTVKLENIGGKQGILAVIPNFAVSVERRVIGGDSFSTLTYKSRPYNGLDTVEIDEMAFADGAVVESDKQTLRLTLIGSITGGDKKGNVGVGKYTVSFVADDPAYSGVANDNYAIDIDSLNKTFSGEKAIEVEITPAQLVPNLIFKSKEYNAQTLVAEDGYEFGTTDFRTLNFYDELASELAHLTLTREFTVDLSKAGKKDANVYADADGGYMHSVLLSSFTLTAEDGIDLKNYELVGLKDEDGNAVELTSGLKVDNFEIEGAIELVKALIRVIDNDVKVRDKIYDDSYTATIDVAVPDTVPEEDRPYLSIVASGSFKSKAVGNNISVTFTEGGAKLVVSDAKYAYLIGNYDIQTTTSMFVGNILARPVGVSVDLGVKTYDSLASINTDNVVYTFDSSELSTMIERDRSKYNVQTTGGAFFDDANVAFDEQGVVTKKKGNVFNPVLKDKNSTLATLSNYRLVAVETKEREGVTPYAVLLADGTIILGAEYEIRKPAAPEEALAAEDSEAGGQTAEQLDVKVYFYDLPSTSHGILASNAEAADKARGSESFIGYIDLNGVGYLLVDDAYAGEGAEQLDAPITYIAAMGTIERQTLSIASGAVQATKTTKAFTKQYDGTVKFFGKLNTDFTFDRTKLAGLRGDDDVYLANITGEFDKADSTATVVIFKGTLAGAAKDNYILSDNATATVSAKIAKRVITATLADGTMSYGTLLRNIVGDITYTMGTEPNGPYAVTVVGQEFYMKLYDFLRVTGFMTGAWEDIPAEDKSHIDVLTANSLYSVTESGEFQPYTGDPNVDTYLKLGGEFLSLPQALATFDGPADAGETAERYVLNGGNATNFAFEFAYTHGVTSTLTVVPKDVYIAATNIGSRVHYGDKLPTGNIAFYDETGAPYAFNTTLFYIGNTYYGPTFGWYLYDTAQGTSTLETYPRVQTNTSGFEKMYVGKFDIPAGVNYAEGTAPDGKSFKSDIKNYTFHFGEVGYQQNEGGQNNYYIQYSGSSLTALTATLVVEVPELNGLTAAAYTEFVYDGDNVSATRGTNKLLSMISGLRADDSVAFNGTRTATWLSSQETLRGTAAIYLPGTYSGTLTVTRTYRWDDGDATGYSLPQTFDVSFAITPKTPTLSTQDDSVRFDGKVYAYDCRNNISGDMNLDNAKVDLMYEKLVGSVYYPAYTVTEDGRQIPLLKDSEGYYALDARGNRTYYAEADVKLYAQTDESGNVIGILDVGAYRVSITPKDSTIRNAGYIYQKTTAYAYVTITARPVEVKDLKVDGLYASGTDAQGAAVFSMMYDAEKQYGSLVNYDVLTYDSQNIDPSAVILKENTKIIGLENVTEAGRYSFSVIISQSTFDASNYSFVAAKGVLELKLNSFLSESGKGLTADDSLKLAQDEGIVANRLTVRHIKSSGGSGTDLDLWKRLETYMPSIGANARLAGVVQVRLYLGSTRVYTSGETMSLSIKIPEGVNSELKDVVVYVRNANGGLVRLGDYSVANGKLNFVTNYLGEIVFVDLSTSRLPTWAIWTIVASAVAVAVFAAWVAVAYIMRRSKLKKLV